MGFGVGWRFRCRTQNDGLSLSTRVHECEELVVGAVCTMYVSASVCVQFRTARMTTRKRFSTKILLFILSFFFFLFLLSVPSMFLVRKCNVSMAPLYTHCNCSYCSLSFVRSLSFCLAGRSSIHPSMYLAWKESMDVRARTTNSQTIFGKLVYADIRQRNRDIECQSEREREREIETGKQKTKKDWIINAPTKNIYGHFTFLCSSEPAAAREKHNKALRFRGCRTTAATGKNSPRERERIEPKLTFNSFSFLSCADSCTIDIDEHLFLAVGLSCN